MMIKLYRIQATLNDEKYFVIFEQTEKGIKVSLTMNEQQSTLFNGDQIEEFIPDLNSQLQGVYTFAQFNTNIQYDENTGEFINL